MNASSAVSYVVEFLLRESVNKISFLMGVGYGQFRGKGYLVKSFTYTFCTQKHCNAAHSQSFCSLSSCETGE